MREWFKPIVGYEEQYEISNLGRVRTLDPRHRGKIMKLEIDRGGYYVIRLVRFGVGKKKAIHRMVYEHFNGPLAPGDIVHHFDENKLNNASNNLMKTTGSEHRTIHNRGLKPIHVKL